MPTVVLRVPAVVDARVVAALRSVSPDLAIVPAGILLAKLRQSADVVLGGFSAERASEIAEAGRHAGLSFDLLPPYGASFVVETLRLDAITTCAPPVIDVVLCPAFGFEVAVRISGGHAPELTVASSNVSIWDRLHQPEPWLVPPHAAPSRKPLEAWRREVAMAQPADEIIAAFDGALSEPDSAGGADGTMAFVRRFQDGAVVELETWSPTPRDRPRRHALLWRALVLADEHLADPLALDVVGRAMRALGAAPGEAQVEERDLDPKPFHCCGDEDLLPFRCAACRQLMVLCYECDTLYPDLDDLDRRELHPSDCLRCGATTADVTTTSAAHRSRRPAWERAGLGRLLRPVRAG